jgi:hypothetical protein
VAGNDGLNLVFLTDAWDHDASLLALTSVWSNADGTALSFDVRVDTRDHEWALDADAETNDLQNALTHELGHALGFAHLSDDRQATMYPKAAPGETLKRDLEDGDIAAAQRVYGNGEVLTDTGDASSDGGPLPMCGTREGGPAGVWATLLGLAVVIRRMKEGA